MGKRAAENDAEEPAFPRGRPAAGGGGTSAGTGAAEEKPEGAAAGPRKRPKLAGARSEKAKDADDGEVAAAIAEVEAVQALRSAPRLRHQDMVEGTLVLAAVREVSDEEVILNLPFNLVGYCSPNQAMEQPAEDSQRRPHKLSERYEPGQLVAAVVTAVIEVGEAKRQRIEVSLRPALLNAGLDVDAVTPNMWLPAVVVGEEEHVFRLSFGIDGLQGLLKKADAPAEPVPSLGSILQVAVTSVSKDSGLARCSTTPGPALPSAALKMESVKAGFLVRARVDRILASGSSKKDKGASVPDGGNAGLVVKFCGALNGVIHSHHQGKALGDTPELKYKQNLAARVLAVVPGPQVMVHLTLLPHILDWSPQKTELSKLGVGERLEGKVLDALPKYGVRLRCARQGSGKTAILGFCPSSRLQDKDAAKEAEAPSAGATFTCRILGFNFLEASVVVTRRPYDLRDDTLVSVSEMVAGQLVKGEIARIAEFGVFVKISEYITGLVHLRHLTDVPLAAVPKKFQVGSKAKCRVLRVFPEKRQVSLTMKKSLVKDDFQFGGFEQARKDMLVTGYVSNVKPYGAIVSFYGDVFGLIPAKEMELDEAPALGMSVQCRVQSANIRRRRIGLSLNLDGGKAASELADTPAATPRRSTPEGATPGAINTVTRLLECTDEGIVVSFTPDGAAGDGAAMRGYVPLAHLADDAAWAAVRHASLAERLKEGAVERLEAAEGEAPDGATEGVQLEERGVVLAPRFNPKRTVSKEGNKELVWYVLLSFKPSLRLAAEEGAFVTELSELLPSQLYTGYVKEVHDFGALVSAGSWKLAGIAPKHQIASHFVEKPSEELTPGQTVRMLLSQVDSEKQRFTVDLRPCPATASNAPVLRREAESLRLLLEARSADATAAAGKPALSPGAVLDATVSAVKDYGVLLKLVGHQGLTAVVLKENMPAGQTPKQGESLKCAVLDFDPSSGIADASLQPELVSAPPLEPGSLLGGRQGKQGKKRKAAVNGEIVETPVKELPVMPALQKPSYSVVWAKEPPIVIFTPPFGQRRWAGQRSALLHGVAGTQLVACCPYGGSDSRDRPKVPRIDRPEEEIHVGAPITMRIVSIKGHQVLCAAPVGLRGHVHATHFVDAKGKAGVAGGDGENPLDGLKKRGLLEARVLTIQHRGENQRGKIYHLELTCRPALLQAGQDASAYEKAIVRWSALMPGQLVPAVVSEVRRNSVWLEVAPGIRGKVSLLDASLELSVVNKLSENFKVGQMFQARVLRAIASQKKLDLALHGPAGISVPKEGQRVLARLEHIEEAISGKGVAASFRLAGRRRGVVHVTELFDFWARFPLKRLKVGTIYEAAILGGALTPDARVELSLRASLVHGRKEGPEEVRPMAVDDVAVGKKVSGYVVNSGPKGVFVALSRLLTARIRLKSLSDQVVMKDSIARLHPVGQLVRDAVVVEVNQEQGHVELSLRKGAGAGGSKLSVEQLGVGDVVTGRVKTVEKYGLFLRLDNSTLDALVHKSEISDTASVSLDSYQPGARVPRAKVLKIENGKVWLGLKPSLFAEDELEDEDDGEDEEEDEPAEPRKHSKGGGDEAAKVLEAFSGVQAASSSSTAKVKKKKEEERQEAAAAAQDSDEEAPWESAAAARGGAGDGAGFEWAEMALTAPDGSDGDSDDEEDQGGREDNRPSKRQKKALKKAEAKELAQKEEENAEGRWANEPRSVEDFERLLLTQGDTSIVWIRYMAFHLKMSDLERARQVAERAVKHVGFSDAKERFNTWVAFMNLECTFGTDETAEAVFKRAASHNEAKHVYLQYARIHQRNKKPQLAAKAYDVCSKKYPQSKKVWIAFLTFLYDEEDLEGARKTLPRALAALPRRKHPIMVSKTAQLEYQQGSVERGRSIFEGLLDSYPKRTDLWSVYLDAHIGAHTPPRAAKPDLGEVRALMERCCSMRLKAMKMRFFFKRWLDFEKKWGDIESQEKVRQKAREFVESQAQ